MKALVAFLITMSFSLSEAAGETLTEATASALDTSPALAAERARLEAVREELPIAWAEALPQVTLDAGAFDTRRSEPLFSTAVRDQPEHWIGTIRTSTLLFGGGRAWFSRREARARIAEAVARYQDSAQNLVLDVARAYGDVRQEQAIVRAQERALANYAEQRRYVAAHVRTGFVTQTDQAQADARHAAARADLAQAQARLVAANEAFLRLVGRPASGLAVPHSLPDLPADLEAALATAQEQNPRILARTANYLASDAAVDVAAAQGRARVTFDTTDSAFATRSGPSQNAEESESSLALRLSVPLFAGGEIRARARQQRHFRDASRADLEEERRRVHEAVSVAWSNLSAARSREESSRIRVESAELAARGVLREQEFGQRTTIDVLDQQNELLQALIALAQAERQTMVAERELAAHLGQLVTSMQRADAPPPAPAASGRGRRGSRS